MVGSIDGLVDGFKDDGVLVMGTLEGVPEGEVVVGNEVVGENDGIVVGV